MGLWEHRAVGLLDRIRGRRDPERQARLERAAADLDRELAANIELASMFDQTRHPVVFENGQFTRHRAVLEAEIAVAAGPLVSVYERMSATEDAMERRGPANTLKPEDKALIETWEGDVRDAQRRLRDAVSAPPLTLPQRLLARLPGGRKTGR
jgi:hypothetical protein